VGVAPDHVALKMLGVRFDQKLVRVEAVTSFGVIRAIHPIAVEHPDVLPADMNARFIGALAQRDALHLMPPL